MNATELVQVLTSSLNFGVLGIVFWLFVGGKLHSEDEMRNTRADLSAERRANDMLHQAVDTANARADTGAMVAQIVMQALGKNKAVEE
jgi:citrate synthase